MRDTHTCQQCVHHVLLPDPFTKELSSFCVCHPPQMFAVAMPQGIAQLVAYPKISPDWPSCGDYYKDEVI